MAGSPDIRRALISVYDKTGIVEFAGALHAEFGIEIISTGGSARTLAAAGIPVTPVEQITGYPDMLDGRVKSLHPRVHAAILADRDDPGHLRQLAALGIAPIDMVVVNLYPFEQAVAESDSRFEQALEMIDIGGPCLLRAAAKNHRHVLVVAEASEAEYRRVLEFIRSGAAGRSAQDLRRRLAWRAFLRAARYDSAVATWLSGVGGGGLPAVRARHWRVRGSLRYGENPHQRAELLENLPQPRGCNLAVGGAEFPCAAELSFNNYADASAALELCAELTRAGVQTATARVPGGPSGRAGAQEGGEAEVREAGAPAGPVACLVKHGNACGVGTGQSPLEAYHKAYRGDPKAALGGVLAVNFHVAQAFAEAVMETYARWGRAAGAGGFFVEVWVAPSFDRQAVAVIRGSRAWGRRVRLLAVGDMARSPDPDETDCRRIAGGLLVQAPDLVGLNERQWRVVTGRAPTAQENRDLRLAWLIAKHTRSNAVSLCKDGMLIGNGAGQMSRVMSCRIATWLARDNGHDPRGASAASDAFFPFRDGPELLAEEGISAIIQPGGSKRDQEVIDCCNQRGVAMVFTGTRHLRH